jgi:hypothetical protein
LEETMKDSFWTIARVILLGAALLVALTVLG